VRNSEEKLKIFAQNIWLDPENFKITRADIKETGKENIRLESDYSSFEDVDGQLFPYKIEYNIRTSGTIRVKADFSRVTINTPQQFPFKIPEEFTPLR
jgi:outer membrane lipoprotein-sorting protein